MTRRTLCTIAWVLTALVAAVRLGTWGADRDPPFRRHAYTATATQPGSTMKIVALVTRNVERGCNVTFSRYIYDSAGYRFDIASNQYMSGDQVAAMERKTPGELRLLVPIPDGMAPGTARLQTVLTYRCNVLHEVWPIDTVMEFDVQILPRSKS